MSSLVPCSACGHHSTKVLGMPWRKRPKRHGSVVKRFRKCVECGAEQITAEFVVNHPETPELTEALRRTRFRPTGTTSSG